MAGQEQDALTPYRVIQLQWSQAGGARNGAVEDFEALVTHHPQTNRGARLQDGVVMGGQPGRSFGVVGGEIQEIEVRQPGRSFGLSEDQVLLKKDFMLEDSRLGTGVGSRSVDVPSPVSGVVGRADAASGLVDILDRKDGEVIARVRHMSPLLVQKDDVVEYGQALGVQNKQATGAVHVHMEVDTRYYKQYENYVEDLVSGRLSMDPDRREVGIPPRPVVDDGTLRIGESAGTVRLIQQRLNEEGYRGADNQPLAEDGVYRLSMQQAVINYQEANGLQQTGDIDPATVRSIAPPLLPPVVNPESPGELPPYVQPFGQSGDSTPRGAEDPLLAQARDAMQRLEAGLGRDYDGNSECMAASAACLAKESGFSRIDHVMLSQATATTRQGENVFVVQGEPGDPAHRRAHMATAEALAVPAEESIRRLQEDGPGAVARNPHQEQAEQLAQQEQQRPRVMG